MIKATDKAWNSATTLYIARRLQALACGRQIAVLDMGCGDGIILEQLIDYNYDLYGYDFERRRDTLIKKFKEKFRDDFDSHIKITGNERTIPIPDNFFDVIYANQVFEHVKFLDSMFAECARVLKPKGVLVINFPLATCPIEGHSKILFAHWVPPGKVRVQYLRIFYALRIRPRVNGLSALETATYWGKYLRERTYYRFFNEIVGLAEFYFNSCEIDTGEFVRAKIDLLKGDRNFLKCSLG